jgi:hypothetical protein
MDSPLEGDGFELPVPRKLGLRRGRRLALHLGSLTLRRRGPDWNATKRRRDSERRAARVAEPRLPLRRHNIRGEPIILNGDFLGGEVLGAICGGYAVAKCPSPRANGRTGVPDTAWDSGRLAARGGRGRIGAPILNALLPYSPIYAHSSAQRRAGRPHILLGVSRKRAMGCGGPSAAERSPAA